MQNTYAFTTKNKTAKISLCIVLAMTALFAAYVAWFFGGELQALLMKGVTLVPQSDAAPNMIIVAIKLGLFCFLFLAMPCWLTYLLTTAANIKEEDVFKRIRLLSLFANFAAWAAVLLLVFVVPAWISQGLFTIDRGETLFELLNYRMNSIIAVMLAVFLLLEGYIISAAKYNDKNVLQKQRITLYLLLPAVAIVFGFHLPIIMMMVLYIVSYFAFEIGFRLGILHCRRAIERKERIKAAETVLAQLSLSEHVTVQGAVAEPGEYELEPDETFVNLLARVGEKDTVAFAVIGGPAGYMVDKTRFAQRIASFSVPEPVITFYSVYDCPVAVTAACLKESLRKYGNIGSLSMMVGLFENIRTGKLDKRIKTVISLLTEELRAADTDSRRAVLRLPDSALRCFEHAFTEHCEYKHCEYSVCRELFDSACSNSCPVNKDLNGILGLLAEGKNDRAWQWGEKDNPYLLSCCYGCATVACERHCTSHLPIRSMMMESGMGEKMSDSLFAPAAPSGKKVAVVGAGMSGLTACYYLRQFGHEVTLFEKNDYVGGSIAEYIPDFILPREIFAAETERILQSGFAVEYGCELGDNIMGKDLREKYDAVLLAIGAQKERMSEIAGLDNALTARDFLHRYKQGEIEVKDASVIVIGNDDRAFLAAEAALRAGCSQLCLVDSMGVALPERLRKAIEQYAVPFKHLAKMRAREIKKIESGYELMAMSANIASFSPDVQKRELQADMVINSPSLYVDTVLLATSGFTIAGYGPKYDEHSLDTGKPGLYVCGTCCDEKMDMPHATRMGRDVAFAINKFLTAQEDVALPLDEQAAAQCRADVEKALKKRSFCRGCSAK